MEVAPLASIVTIVTKTASAVATGKCSSLAGYTGCSAPRTAQDSNSAPGQERLCKLDEPRMASPYSLAPLALMMGAHSLIWLATSAAYSDCVIL